MNLYLDADMRRHISAASQASSAMVGNLETQSQRGPAAPVTLGQQPGPSLRKLSPAATLIAWLRDLFIAAGIVAFVAGLWTVAAVMT